MHEIIVNLHMHTRYSDGGGSHQDIAEAALKYGLDAVIVTDHNVLVSGFDGYIKDGKRKVLMLIGQKYTIKIAIRKRIICLYLVQEKN